MSFQSIFSLLIGVGVSCQIQAQTCNPYYPMGKGTRWVVESYNKTNKFISKSIQTVKETGQSDDGFFVGNIIGEVIDFEENIIGAIDYQVKCMDGHLFVSMNSVLNPEQMADYQDMEVEVDGGFLELPADLQPGMSLPDAEIEVKVKNESIPIMILKIVIIDRTVEKFESINTPAGTFECAKITFRSQSKMGETIPINIKTFGAEWLSKDTGLVRSEQYDMKNNLTSYSVLTEFDK